MNIIILKTKFVLKYNNVEKNWQRKITSKKTEENILNRTKGNDIICLHDC